MKQICFLCCCIMFSAFSFCQNKQLDLQVDVLISEVTPFESIPIQIKLFNNSPKKIHPFELYPNKTILVEIRNMGSKEWTELDLFDPKVGFQFIVGDNAGYTELAPKDTIALLIGTIPWKDDGGRTNKRYYSPYQGDGFYELRVIYYSSPKNKMTSKIFKFEVNSKYDNYEGEVMKYVESLRIPHFMYAPFAYGYYLKPNKEFSASIHSAYILSNFGKSLYAAWTKLYLIEAGFSTDANTTLKELLTYPNPLIRERAKMLLKYP